MTMNTLDRRRFLRLGGALSLFGGGAPFALQLAASGVASAAGASDYKALVCIFMVGGNDGANTVLATDDDSWGRYFAARNTGVEPIALMPVGTAPTRAGQVSPVTNNLVLANTPPTWGGVLPIVPNVAQPIPPGTNAAVRNFALHPFMGSVQSLFKRQRLAIVANLGPLTQPITKSQFLAGSVPIPRNLFSHNDQQSTWQSGAIEGAKVGWGGAIADKVIGANGVNTEFTTIAPYNSALFLTGRSVDPYVVIVGALPAIVMSPNYDYDVVRDTTSTSDLANDYGAVVSHSINSAGKLNNAVSQSAAATIAAPPNYVSPSGGGSQVNALAVQLQTVAKLIAAAPQLGIGRQVFFVTLSGFDTHAGQNGTQPDLLGQLAQALAYFDSTLSNVGGADLSASVTTFTASEFGRTFTSNGSGTDHAWGSHHFVMGGAVKGGNIYGQFPTLGVDQGDFYNPDMAGNILLPTSSVDQYGATLATWFGVSPADLSAIFPNLANFNSGNLGFI